jgi:hypothetical protein
MPRRPGFGFAHNPIEQREWGVVWRVNHAQFIYRNNVGDLEVREIHGRHS